MGVKQCVKLLKGKRLESGVWCAGAGQCELAGRGAAESCGVVCAGCGRREGGTRNCALEPGAGTVCATLWVLAGACVWVLLHASKIWSCVGGSQRKPSECLDKTDRL